MSRSTAPAAPLEADDPERARWLKAKIRDRVSDVRRHLVALRAAMAEFGEDFDLEALTTAYGSDNPVLLNQVNAVERGEGSAPSSQCAGATCRATVVGSRRRTSHRPARAMARRLVAALSAAGGRTPRSGCPAR